MIPGIADSYTQKIMDLFRTLPKGTKAILFGSRAKGNYREGSDIDIALKGTSLTIQIWGDSHGWSKKKSPPFEVIKIIELSARRKLKDKAFLQQKYVEEQRSMQDIGKMIGCTGRTVLNYLRQNEIIVRPIGARAPRNKVVPYGYQMRGIKMVKLTKQQNILSDIGRWREQGESYRKIAEKLNGMGIQTRSGKGKWHARSIMVVAHRMER